MTKENRLTVSLLLLLTFVFCRSLNAGEPSPLVAGFHLHLHRPGPAAGADGYTHMNLSLAENKDAAPAPYRLDFNKRYWKGLGSDFKHILSAPFHWEKKGWLTAAAVMGIAITLYATDDKTMSWIQKHRNTTTDKISRFAENFGDFRVVFPGLALLYGYGAIAKDQKAKDVVLMSVESIAVTGLVVQALKFLTHRHRPNNGGHTEWDGPGLSSSNLSFPSGHSAMAFGLAAVISSTYKSPAVGVSAYLIASLTALSRDNDKKHWPSDIFLGAAISYFITRRIVNRRQKRKKIKTERASAVKRTGGRFRVFPLVTFDHIGLSLTFRL